MTDTVINVEEVCRRVVASPRYARISTIEQLAVCSFALERMAERERLGSATELDIEPAPEGQPPRLKASLAASLALAIAAHDVAVQSDQDSWAAQSTAFNHAFNTLKTQFEKEFPHGA